MSVTHEVSLKSIILFENGEKILRKGTNVLTVSLLGLSDGSTDRVKAFKLPLESTDESNDEGKPLTINKVYSFADALSSDKLIYRGSFKNATITFKVGLGIVKSRSKFEKILITAAAGASTAAVGALTGGSALITIALAGGGALVEKAFEAAQEKDKKTKLLGEYAHDFANEAPQNDFEIELKVKEKIKYVLDRQINEAEGTGSVTYHILHPGFVVAKLVISVVTFEDDKTTTQPVVA